MGTAEKRRGDVVRTKITAPAEGLPGLPPPSESDTSSGSFSDSSLSDSSITTSGSEPTNPRRFMAARRTLSPARKAREDDHGGRSRARNEDNERNFRSRSPARRSPSSRRHSPPPRKTHVSHKRPASYSRSPSPRDQKRALTERRGNGKNEGGRFSLKEEAKGGVPMQGDSRGGGKEADAEPAKGGFVSRVVNGKVALVAAPRKGVDKQQGASDGGPEEELGGERKADGPEGEGKLSGKGPAAEGETTPQAETVSGRVGEEGPEGEPVPRGNVLAEEGAPRGGVSEVPAGVGTPAEEAAPKQVEQGANAPRVEIAKDGDDVDMGDDDVDSDVEDRSEKRERELGGPELGKATDRCEGQQKRSSRWDRKAPGEEPLPGVAGVVEAAVARESPEGDRRGLGSDEDRGGDEKGVVERLGRTDGDETIDKRRKIEGFDRREEREALGAERFSRGEEHERHDRRREDEYGLRGEHRRPDERRQEDRYGIQRNGTDRNRNDWGKSEPRGRDRFGDDRRPVDEPRSRHDDRFADERGSERRFEDRRFEERRFGDRRPVGREHTRTDERRYEDRGSERRGYRDRGHDSWHGDRARPPFREERRPEFGGPRTFDQRGVGGQGREYPPKAVPFESDETMQADREERARRPAWGSQRGGGFQQPSKKWGHDKFVEVNQGGFSAGAGEDSDAKIEALLAL